MKTKTILILVIIFSLSSCTGILKVHQKNKNGDFKSAKGIPFYTQKLLIKQETDYLYWWYNVRLIEVEIKDGKEVRKVIIQKSVEKNQFSKLVALTKSIYNYNASSAGKPEDIISELSNIKTFEVASSLSDKSDLNNKFELVKNTWKREVVIDYDNPYYINGTLPWFGKGSFTQKVNADGTLSESITEVDTQLDDFITEILPIKDILSAVLIPFSEEEVAAEEVDSVNIETLNNLNQIEGELLEPSKPKKQFILELSHKGYLYSFTVIHDESNIKGFEALSFDLKKGNYTRSDWPKVSPPIKKKVEEEKPTIHVSGKIELPKEKIK